MSSIVKWQRLHLAHLQLCTIFMYFLVHFIFHVICAGGNVVFDISENIKHIKSFIISQKFQYFSSAEPDHLLGG